MAENKTVVGTIEDKSMTEGDDWVKWTFKVLNESTDKNITLGMFINEEEKKEGDKEKREKMVKTFKKGARAKFTYWDQKKGETTYHNITKIEEATDVETVESSDEAADEADKKYNVKKTSADVPRAPSPYGKKDEMSKAEWAMKDRRGFRKDCQIRALGFAQTVAELVDKGLMTKERAKEILGDFSQDRLFELAKKFEDNIYREEAK